MKGVTNQQQHLSLVVLNSFSHHLSIQSYLVGAVCGSHTSCPSTAHPYGSPVRYLPTSTNTGGDQGSETVSTLVGVTGVEAGFKLGFIPPLSPPGSSIHSLTQCARKERPLSAEAPGKRGLWTGGLTVGWRRSFRSGEGHDQGC